MIKKTTLVTLLLLVFKFSFSHNIMAQPIKCTDANEGQRIGSYVCQDGKWVYVGSVKTFKNP